MNPSHPAEWISLYFASDVRRIFSELRVSSGLPVVYVNLEIRLRATAFIFVMGEVWGAFFVHSAWSLAWHRI